MIVVLTTAISTIALSHAHLLLLVHSAVVPTPATASRPSSKSTHRLADRIMSDS